MALALSNSVYVHCPKTGGTWVRSVLQETGVTFEMIGKHTHCRHIPKEHKDKFKFVFVRHPLTWYQSYFAYKTVQGWSDDHLDRHCRAPAFRQFLNKVLDVFPGYCSTVLAERYFNGADFVGRFERLRSDLVLALEQAGETYSKEIIETVSPQNVSNYRLVDVGYSLKLRERILKAEQGILKRFYE